MLLKRGTESGERRTEVWERVVSGNPTKYPRWQDKELETIEKRRNNTVVRKSYRPKGQPRSTRNEFPIRLRKFSKTSNMAAQACEVNASFHTVFIRFTALGAY